MKVGFLRLGNSNLKLMYVNTHTYHTYMYTRMYVNFLQKFYRRLYFNNKKNMRRSFQSLCCQNLIFPLNMIDEEWCIKYM